MKRVTFALLSVIGVLGATLWAADDRAKEIDRVGAATNVLNEIMATPDKGVPEEILSKAQCVAVVPSMMKGGFIVGASYGKGVATCRTGKGCGYQARGRQSGLADRRRSRGLGDAGDE